MGKGSITTVALGTAALLALAAGPALACDNHDEASYAILATLEYRGMTAQEVQAAQREAIDRYHARQIELARARFVRRFQADPAPADGAEGEVQLASAEQSSL